MSKSVKTFILTIVVMMTTLISLAIVVDKKLEPLEIKKVVKSSFEKAFPKSDIQIGKVDYSMGTMVRIYLNNIQVDKDTVQIKKVTCKVPLLAILFGGSTIKVSITQPYIKKNVTNIFSLTGHHEFSFDIPAFISKNKIDFNISDVQVHNSSEKVKISKVLIKNFSLTSSMAYEVQSQVKMEAFGKNYDFDSQVIGEVNLASLSKNKKIKSDIVTEIKNIKREDGKTYPRMKGSFKIELDKMNKISGNGELSQTGILESKFDFYLKDNNLQLSSVQGTIQNNAFLRSADKDLSSKIDGNHSITLIEGILDYNLITSEVKPELKIDISKPFIIELDNIKIPTRLNLEIKKYFVKAAMSHDLLSGIISSNLDINFDKDYSFQKIDGLLNFNNIVFDRNFINSFVAKDNNKSQVTEVEYSDSRKKMPKINIIVKGQNNLLGDAKVDISSIVHTDEKQITIKDFKMTTLGGSVWGEMNFNNKTKQTNVDLNIKDLSLKEFKPLLHVIVPNFAGQLSGKIKAMESPALYSYDVKMNVNDFVIGLIDLSPPINDFLLKVGQSKIFTDEERLNNFKQIEADFSLNNDGIIIKKANLKSVKASLLKVKGEIKNKGASKIRGVLQTSKIIPFRYIGTGNILNPDLNYTKRKLK